MEWTTRSTYLSRPTVAFSKVSLHVDSLTYDSHGPGAEPMRSFPNSMSLGPVRIHQNLARLARLQTLHRLGKIFHRNAVGDHGMQVEFPRL